ncbi:uncharacterized protein LOC132272405 [Cornus florida]|uniref:uncharacterized protein LOC132272405 n=1 Tax=Cornus florida TaxID=4283 RepID=UPI00289C429D|nr:uncharacterized protein LOC132272405 [Cornus florida]
MGDFNTIVSINEKNGGSNRLTPAITEFRDCLLEAELVDLRYKGIFFTWNNQSFGEACSAKKLDRVLANSFWHSIFPQLECTFLPQGGSDHNPMVVKLTITLNPHKAIPFKFFNAWCFHPHFFSIVDKQWKTFIHGTSMFQAIQKLKSLKQPLRDEYRDKFSNLKEKISKVKLELDRCQAELDHKTFDADLRNLKKTLSAEHSRLLLAEEDVIRQKSRITWLKLGDSNTSYFHKSFLSRSNSKRILSLTSTTGEPITTPEGIKAEALAFFKHLLGENPPPQHGQEILGPFITKTILPQHIPLLESIPTDLEIKQCIFSMSKDKAPGPDGFNAYFFH